ncbi:hypothetical protein QTI33_01945 [Variovorax sp. J22P271]|uniref:hypothetical protein n=1 Tax=Variovorax davisae TaxID=3053515 RepID=UPI0025755FCC|nr:hypothetical protein [Variovorax sp. J22P271]MDM0030899.1 hypothetical protein [Variovorax sp. J22P271]
MLRIFQRPLCAGALCTMLTLVACDEHAAQHLAPTLAGIGQANPAAELSEASNAYFGERFAQVQAALAQQRDETPAVPSF